MTGIVFATEEEAQPFLRQYKRGRFEELREGEHLYDDDLLVCLTGTGKIKATLRTERLLQRIKPERLLHVGTCTGLREDLTTGTIIAASQVFEGDRIELAAPTYPRMPLEIPFTNLPQGTLVTQDHVVKGDSEENYWQRIADFSDMTGYAVAYVSATHGVPCHIVKIVTSGLHDSSKELRKTLDAAHEQMAAFLVKALAQGIASGG